PVFRAEPHDTARHINQYTSLDVELGFITDHFDVMAQLTRVLRGMLAEVARSCAAELALLGARLPGVPAEIPHLHFTEALELLAGPQAAVGGEDFYIGLRFYHLKLHAYVVIELKAGDFKPEHTGKLGFYMTAVDEQMKAPEDGPTIGLLLCKSKNRVVAEY